MSNCKLSVKRFKEFIYIDKDGTEHDSVDGNGQPIDHYNHLVERGEIYLVGYKHKDETDCPEIKVRLEDIGGGGECDCNIRYKDGDIQYWDEENEEWQILNIPTSVEHLTDIGDVNENSGIRPGYVLAWFQEDGKEGYWVPSENMPSYRVDWNEQNPESPKFIKNKPTIPEKLDDLNDVDTDGVEDGFILYYSASEQLWKPGFAPSGGGATTLKELTDTQIGNTITNGYVLTWNGSKWVPQAVTGTPGEDGQDGQDGRSVEDIQVNGGGSPSTVSGATNTYNCIDQNGQVIGSFNVTNGAQGTPGTNGLTPQVRVNSATHQLQVSYDGTTWEDKGLVNIQEGGDYNNFAINIKPSSTDCVSLGDAYIDSEGNLMVLVDVAQGTFDNAGNIRGPQGLQGPQGATGPTGPTGKGIANISYTSTSGLVDTYTITYTDNTTSTFTVTNGNDGTSPTLGIQCNRNISDDGYDITFNVNGTTVNQCTVYDGNGISSITGPTGTGKQKTYTINFTNGGSTTFTVNDGADGKDGTTFELYRITFSNTNNPQHSNDHYVLTGTPTWQKWNSQTGDYQTSQQPSIDEHSVFDVCPADRDADAITKNLQYGTFGTGTGTGANFRLIFCSVKDPYDAGTLVYTLKLYSNIQ